MTAKTMAGHVRAALREMVLRPQDQAAARLAVTYAKQIDAHPELLDKLGPRLLAVLDALTMTPRARAAVAGKGGAPRDNGPDTDAQHTNTCTCLPCQRARRIARSGRAASVDSPAS